MPVGLMVLAKKRMRTLRCRSFGAYVRMLIERDMGRPDDVGQIRDAMRTYPGLAEFLRSVTGVDLR